MKIANGISPALSNWVRFIRRLLEKILASESKSYYPSYERSQPMPSKLGAHVLRMTGLTGAFVAAGPVVVKFAGDWAASAQVPPGAMIIGRKVADDDAQSQRAQGKTPAEAAHQFVHAWKQLELYQQNPRITYWEGHNEPAWGDLDGMAWYAQMEIERMKLMDGLGLRCVIGNFATGTPQMELWPAFVPACRYALEHGHILGLHEYSTPFMWWMTGKYQIDRSENCITSDGRLAGWTTLRYRQVYDRFLKPAGLGQLPLIITENGLDPLVNPTPDDWPHGTYKHLGHWWKKGPSAWGYPLPDDWVPEGGWHLGDSERFYAEQLAWYDWHLRQDSYVIGATVFTFGNYGPPWKDFDVAETNAANWLIEHVTKAKSAGGEAGPPVPIPPAPAPGETRPRGAPRVQYARTYVLLPQSAGPDWLTAIADLVTQRGWTVGYNPDDAGVGDLDIRRVIGVNPAMIGANATAAWYAEQYPGVQFMPLEAATPAELLVKLQRLA